MIDTQPKDQRLERSILPTGHGRLWWVKDLEDKGWTATGIGKGGPNTNAGLRRPSDSAGTVLRREVLFLLLLWGIGRLTGVGRFASQNQAGGRVLKGHTISMTPFHLDEEEQKHGQNSVIPFKLHSITIQGMEVPFKKPT